MTNNAWIPRIGVIFPRIQNDWVQLPTYCSALRRPARSLPFQTEERRKRSNNVGGGQGCGQVNCMKSERKQQFFKLNKNFYCPVYVLRIRVGIILPDPDPQSSSRIRI